MNIGIIGGSGFIGTYLLRSFLKKEHKLKYSFFSNEPPYSNKIKLDITNQNDVEKFFESNDFDLIIFASALTNVDLCETNPEMAHKINVTGIQNVVNSCKNYNSKIIYISTSAVFDGSKLSFNEWDQPNPTSVYGKTKLVGEGIVKNAKIENLILRTDQPYGWIEKWHHPNSVTKVIEKLSKKKQYNEISDWYNTPTYVLDFVNAMNLLIKKRKEGIFHIVGSEYISRYEWAQKTAKIFGFDKKLIQKISSSQLKLPVKRYNIHLNNDKLEDETGHKMMNVNEGLEEMLKMQINF